MTTAKVEEAPKPFFGFIKSKEGFWEPCANRDLLLDAPVEDTVLAETRDTALNQFQRRFPSAKAGLTRVLYHNGTIRRARWGSAFVTPTTIKPEIAGNDRVYVREEPFYVLDSPTLSDAVADLAALAQTYKTVDVALASGATDGLNQHAHTYNCTIRRKPVGVFGESTCSGRRYWLPDGVYLLWTVRHNPKGISAAAKGHETKTRKQMDRRPAELSLGSILVEMAAYMTNDAGIETRWYSWTLMPDGIRAFAHRLAVFNSIFGKDAHRQLQSFYQFIDRWKDQLAKIERDWKDKPLIPEFTAWINAEMRRRKPKEFPEHLVSKLRLPVVMKLPASEKDKEEEDGG